MNSNMINNSINNKSQMFSARKPCCKVCKDAGKSENEYSSHYVKDLNGQVTCPTLLSQECRFCRRKGHTTSHCSELAKKKEKETRMLTAKPPISPPKKEVKKSNVFAYLEMNSDDSESEDEFPAVAPVIALQKTIPSTTSYAAMAAKPIPEYNTNQKKEFMTKLKSATTWEPLAPGQKKSWAQMNDEDSDEDSDEDKDKEQKQEEDNSAW
jgi:ribosomal protein L12E/L44/L45/RPP1/RPP2